MPYTFDTGIFKTARILAMLVLISLLTACASTTPAPVQPTAAAEVPAATATTAATVTQVPTSTPIPPTATSLPTATPLPLPTNTPVPPTETATPQPALALQPGADGAAGFCIPEGMIVPQVSDPPPFDAKLLTFTDGTLDAYNLPATACTLIFTFNQTLTPEMLQGLKFQLFNLEGAAPWLEIALQPVEGRPQSAGVVLTHGMLVTPTWWDIYYKYSLLSADQKLVDLAPANFHRWKPDLCWTGLYPDINTMRCPLPQDQHPWDPMYGKPMPTFPPDR